MQTYSEQMLLERIVRLEETVERLQQEQQWDRRLIESMMDRMEVLEHRLKNS
jgi:hypothetical protein